MLGLWRRHHVIQTPIDFGRQADSRRERVKVSLRVIGYLFCSIRNITIERQPSAESGLDFKPFQASRSHRFTLIYRPHVQSSPTDWLPDQGINDPWGKQMS